MWPGQQPPGGEQNPQDPNQNPYQQPGYQQPNPYQQPGYQQQPNPYAQQPGQPGWGTPVDPLGAPQPPQGGGGNNKTKVVAIVAAAAVVVAAGVTGFLVLGGDKDDTANDSDKKGAATTAPASKKPSASASGGGENPRGSESEKPTIPGWKVVVNPRFGTEFDVPADWELDSADTSVGFEWEEKGKMDRTTVTAPAYLKSKWCSDDSDKDGREEDTALATAGTRGENGATNAAQAAETRVPWWIFGGYTQPDKKSVKVTKPKPFKTTSGLEGSVATAYSQNTPQNGKCDTEGKAITFAFKNGAGDFVTWNLYGAKGVDDEIPEATIQKILTTVRLTDAAPTDS